MRPIVIGRTHVIGLTPKALAEAMTLRCTVCARAITKALADCVLQFHHRQTRCRCGAHFRMPHRVKEALRALATPSASAS